MIFKSLCLCLLAIYVSKAEELDLDAIEKELENADFIEIDGSELVDHEVTNPRARGFTDKIKEFCAFDGHKGVGCCAQMKMPGMGSFKVPACVNITVNAEEKNVDVSVTAIGNKLVEHKFPIDKVDRICDRLPGKLDFLKFCLYTSTTQSDENGLVSCSSMDVIFKKTTAVIVNFSCLQFKDGELTFDNHQDVNRDSMFTIKFKNPIKSVMGLIKGFIQKNKKE